MARKSYNLLPGIFQTDTNKKFLAATVDQLISEPDLKTVNGYIGRKFAPTYKSKDSYIVESTDDRQNYQLEPSIVVRNDAGEITFFATYMDFLNKIRYYGGLTDKHTRLFDGETYTFDPQISFDKFVNYGQYYWLPNGPDAVAVNTGGVELTKTFTVVRNTNTLKYEFTSGGGINNTITLARGGVYTFEVDQPDNPFWIQSEPGADGKLNTAPTLSSRDVLGVTNNGADVGTVTFNVPLATAQDRFSKMKLVSEVDYATPLYYRDFQGRLQSQFLADFPQYQGIVGQFDGKTLIFASYDPNNGDRWDSTGIYDQGPANVVTEVKLSDTAFAGSTVLITNSSTETISVGQTVIGPGILAGTLVLAVSGPVVTISRPITTTLDTGTAIVTGSTSLSGLDAEGFDSGPSVPESQYTGIWKIVWVDGVLDENGNNVDPVITLQYVQDTSIGDKVYVKYGVANANKEFYREVTGLWVKVPLLTSQQTSLWLQDGNEEAIYTEIRLVDSTNWVIDVEKDILGKKNYTSPNGVEFTSGLKIRFSTDVTPDQYKGGEYYVEGVGDSISLVNTALLVTPEAYNDELATLYPLQRIVLNKSATSAIAAGTVINVGGVDITIDSEVPIGRSYLVTLDSISELQIGVAVTGEGIPDAAYVTGLRADSVFPEYITINRASPDLNSWSRNNRWFHADVIAKTAGYNNSALAYDQDLRATRPIVQFGGGKQLFNHGRLGKQPIDILDTTTLDAFNELDGKVLDSAFGVPLYDGLRVLFAADYDPAVRDKIYVVNLVQYEADPVTGVPQGPFHVKLVQAADGDSEYFDSVVVAQGKYKGSQWWFDAAYINEDGTAGKWKEAQQKTQSQQDPLFDVYDTNGVSFSDQTVYPRSDFVGTRFFGYDRTSTGANDKVLGFPLKYRSFTTQGDIEFANYYDSDTFTYQVDKETITQKINAGFIQKIAGRLTTYPKNNWSTVPEYSKQYQLISHIYDGTQLRQINGTNYIINDFAVDITPEAEFSIPYTKVYVNGAFIKPLKTTPSDYETGTWSYVNPTTNSTAVGIYGQLTIGDKIDILIYSRTKSDMGFYQVPSNLNSNAQNIDLTTVTLGQFRNHVLACSENSTELVGELLGSSNLRDIELTAQGGTILQHAATVPYGALFLLDEQANFMNALRFAQQEYAKFKNKFLEYSISLPGIDPTDPASSVDLILKNINAIKNKTFPWYYSDMVPYGTLKNTINYTVYDPLVDVYEITTAFNGYALSNQAVLIYITPSVDRASRGWKAGVKQQLVFGFDYYFNTDRPAVTFLNYNFEGFEVDDLIEIVEYQNTDGCYIPETPTKLGLWPKFIPELFIDDTFRQTTDVIRGHDGSITPVFNDFRDGFLLELENRIYNNIKLPDVGTYQDIFQIAPGFFRAPYQDFTLEEVTQVLTKSFLTWVGNNKLDFTANNTFDSNDPFTWNYNKFVNKLDGTYLPGSWRACYQYFYDTFRPHINPWEMLGFSTEPDWWIDQYGPGPYSGGNKLLWEDLEAGTIQRGPRSGGQNYTPWETSVNYTKGQYVSYNNLFYVALGKAPASTQFDYSKWKQVDEINVPWIPANDSNFARPGLSYIIPVDENGYLRSPAEILAQAYNPIRANSAWAVGQQGPVEFAWRQSSDFPFAVQQALALSKPARYFGQLIDTYRYQYNYYLGQQLTIDTNEHLRQGDILFNGDTSLGIVYRGAGYLNWIADYLTNQGINPSTKITPMLRNYEINLAYKMAGFSDKTYVQVLAEQSSPTSTNDSVLIPTENFAVHLYKSTPVDRIVYSSVIVEKTNGGWSVRGYDLSTPFFTIIPSVVNSNAYKITVLNSEAVIFNNYQDTKLSIPYGYEFTSQQQVADFLVSYERYLIAQGFVFDDTDDLLGETRNWRLSVKEFLFWAQQGWKEGSILVLSPVSNQLNAVTVQTVTDGITDSQYGSKVLDQNFKLVKNTDYTVYRTPTEFKLTLTNSASVVGYVELNLVQYEHVLIFDNTTVFNDIIYKPELGNRQYRLKLVGQKTANWDGSLSANGFVYNSGSIQPWAAGKDYLKGDLVEYKNQYYVALQSIVASTDFQFVYWKQLSTGEIKTGLLSNWSSLAVKSKSYYDSYGYFNDAKTIKSSHGLIGFKPRQYLDDLGLNETTQIELYKGYIKQKGSANAVNQLIQSQFNNFTSNISFYEEWAIRIGEYGALDTNPYVEIPLAEKEFSVNPALTEFVGTKENNRGDGITVFNKQQLYKSTDQYTGNIALSRDAHSDYDNDLPTVGYVNIDDVDATIFDLADYTALNSISAAIGTGFTIWCAKDFTRDWNVYRITETDNHITQVTNSLDGFVTFKSETPHQLLAGDIFLIRGFSTAFDGFYQVYQVVDLNNVLVNYLGASSNLSGLTSTDGYAILYVLDSLRFQYMEDARKYVPPHGWITGEKIWIDDDAATSYVQGQPYETPSGTWKVYEKTRPWNLKSSLDKTTVEDYTSTDGYGTSVKMSADSLLSVVGTPQTDLYKLIFSGNITASVGDTITQVSSGATFTALQSVTRGASINVKQVSGSVDLINGFYVNGDTGNVSSALDTTISLNPKPLTGVVNTFDKATTGSYVPGTILDPLNGNTLITTSEFGYTVDLATDSAKTTLGVGAPGSNNDNGFVYLYHRKTATTTFTPAQVIVGNAQVTGDRFGQSIAFDEKGSWLYVGAPGNDRVYVYGLNKNISEQSQTTSIGNLNVIELSGNITSSFANLSVVTQPDSGASVTLLQAVSSGNTIVVNSLTNFLTGSILANLNLSSTVTVNIDDYVTQDSSGANIRIINYIPTSGRIVGRYMTGDQFDTSGNIAINGVEQYTFAPYDEDLLAFTSNVGIYPTAIDKGNIFINDVDTLLHITSIVSQTNANSIDLEFPAEALGDANSLVITSKDRTYLPNLDYTLSGQTVLFKVNVVQSEVTITQQPYFTWVATLQGILGSEFGSALDSSYDGAQLGIGVPNETVLFKGNTYVGAGAVYVYDRSIEAFNTTGTTDFVVNDTIQSVYRVTVDNIEVPFDEYYLATTHSLNDTVRFIIPPAIGKIVYVETNYFKLLELLTGSVVQTGARFGTSLTICSNNCAIYVGAPYYSNSTTYNTGAVFKFHNRGRLYGTNVGTVKNPVFTIGDKIRLDNFEVELTSGTTLDDVVNDINAANILGITAVNEGGYLRLKSDKLVAKNRLRILSGSNTLGSTGIYDAAGLKVFAEMQIILNPYNTPGEYFGTKVILASNAYMLVIASDRGNTFAYTTVDNKATTFDNNSTNLFDTVVKNGSVYIYELYDDPRDAVEHPGRYAFAQQLNTGDLNFGDQFGYAIDIVGTKYVLVSAPGDDTQLLDGGSVYLFENPNQTRGWNLIRYQESKVDIDSVNRMYLYDNASNKILVNMEFIDPAKGKILGQAEQEISYKTAYDPAIYNSGTSTTLNINENLYWNAAQVGQVWWNLDKVRFIDYEQSNLIYRSINWGRLFPGSVVEVCEWVESDVLPSQYVTRGYDGVPKYQDDSAYVDIVYVDPTTNIITSKYYYWVTGKTSVDTNNPRRQLPIKSIQDYIENPKSQGIAYAAVIKNNAVIVYNVGEYLSAQNNLPRTVLHIDYELVKNTSIIHSEYELVQKNNPKSFVPPKVVNKLIDSLSGIDNRGSVVPDPILSVADRYGISYRPRQSMFINRLAALGDLVLYVNDILVRYPIAKEFNLNQLNSAEPIPQISEGEYEFTVASKTELSYIDTANFGSGYRVLVESDVTEDGLWVIYQLGEDGTWSIYRVQSYKTNLYWSYIDWYKSGYTATDKITYITESPITALTLPYVAGDTIKILDTGNGKWELVVVNSALEFETVGIQDGTVKINSNLSNFGDNGLGFDNQGFGAENVRYDQNPNLEIRSIISALRDDIFINELQGRFNDTFFVMMNYLFNEQKYVDWIFKTSFISTTHRLRSLSQVPNYIKDNQTYYQSYIEETKPYRTKIREYLTNYDGTDTVQGNWTDFDLPAYYDTNTRLFRSPSGDQFQAPNGTVYDFLDDDSSLWQLEPYKQWYDNRNSSVDSIIVTDPGTGYTTEPIITIIDQNEIGTISVQATATATINYDTGELIKITIINPGAGYNATPTVKIAGGNGGTDVVAKAYAVLKNNRVRSFDTTMKFDRITYTSTVKEWTPGTAYKAGEIITHAVQQGDYFVRTAYVVNNNIITGGTFVLQDYTPYNAANFNNANDRIIGYYSPTSTMPARDLNQLIPGIDYPGVQVTGLGYSTGPGFDAASDRPYVEPYGIQLLSISARDAYYGNVTLFPTSVPNNLWYDQDNEIMYQYVGGFPYFTNGWAVVADTPTDGVGSPFDDIPFDGVQYDENGSPMLTDQALDTIIRSNYTDEALGSRPEDINVDGGEYVDTYSSHAPEELIPGIMFDALDMKVFTKINANVEIGTYDVVAYRIFTNMLRETTFLRLSDASSARLTQDLLISDTEIHVNDPFKLPAPDPHIGIPGVIFINGERITYFRNYAVEVVEWIQGFGYGYNTALRYGNVVTFSDSFNVSAGDTVLQGATGATAMVTVNPTDANVYMYYTSTSTFDFNSGNVQVIRNSRSYDLKLSSNVSVSVGDTIVQTSSNTHATVVDTVESDTVLVTYENDNRFNFTDVLVRLTDNIVAEAGDILTQPISGATLTVVESNTSNVIVQMALGITAPAGARLTQASSGANLTIIESSVNSANIKAKYTAGSPLLAVGPDAGTIKINTSSIPGHPLSATIVPTANIIARYTNLTSLDVGSGTVALNGENYSQYPISVTALPKANNLIIGGASSNAYPYVATFANTTSTSNLPIRPLSIEPAYYLTTATMPVADAFDYTLIKTLTNINTLSQIRRGTEGTSISEVHPIGSYAVDSSLDQLVPESIFTNIVGTREEVSVVLSNLITGPFDTTTSLVIGGNVVSIASLTAGSDDVRVTTDISSNVANIKIGQQVSGFFNNVTATLSDFDYTNYKFEVSSLEGIYVGQYVDAEYIAADTTVVEIDIGTTTVTLSSGNISTIVGDAVFYDTIPTGTVVSALNNVHYATDTPAFILTLTANITANVGDIITQTTSGANLTVVGADSTSNALLVNYNTETELDFSPEEVVFNGNLSVRVGDYVTQESSGANILVTQDNDGSTVIFGLYTSPMLIDLAGNVAINGTDAGVNPIEAGAFPTVSSELRLNGVMSVIYPYNSTLTGYNINSDGSVIVASNIALRTTKIWYNRGSGVAADGSGLEGAETVPALFLKAETANDILANSIKDLVVTEDTINTMITEDGNPILEE